METQKLRTVVEKVLVLSDLSVFARARTEDLAQLAAHARETDLVAAEEIYARGDSPRALHVVLSGRVELSRRETRREVEPGQAFGTLGLLDREPRAFDAVAVEPTALLTIEGQAFLDALADNSELALGVLESLARRVRTAVLQEGEVTDEVLVG